MTFFSLLEISKITKGILIGENIKITGISIDTRKNFLGSLFIALLGKNFDGHNFLKEAKNSGSTALLVDKKNFVIFMPTIIVNNTIIALGQLGKFIRKKSKANILALTGSVGKTTVKEMTAKILSLSGKTLYTEKNNNNHIGVPLTLIKLYQKYRYAIIEIGSNKTGEIAYLTNLVQPKTALVNNIYPAHLLGFKSVINIAKEKGKIFMGLLKQGTAIININNNYLSIWKHNLKNKNIYFYSLQKVSYSNLWSSDITLIQGKTSFYINIESKKKIKINLPILGYHNISNALAAASLALSVNIPLNNIKEGLNSIKSIPGRLYPIMIEKNKIIIDDSYNSNFASMIAAINVLNNMQGYKILVIGDMLELGNSTKLYHQKILDFILKNQKIDKIFSYGTFSKIISNIQNIGEHFNNYIKLVQKILFFICRYQKITILIKGSHNSGIKNIINKLKEKLCVDEFKRNI